MKPTPLIILFTLFQTQANATPPNKHQIQADLTEILSDIKNNYIYLKDKKIDLNCIKQKYAKKIDSIASEEQTVLFFEVLLDEFYDSHLILNTNRDSSYRLYAPIYISLKSDKFIISSVWQSQLKAIKDNIIGAEILKFNGVDFDKTINNFPTECQDKNKIEIREWLANKVLAGRYNRPRVLTLKLSNNKTIEFDLDKLRLKNNDGLLSTSIVDNIGIIRINNSLGQNDLVSAFDKAIDGLFETNGMIIDLRNTVDGGNSYVARGIMSRFISSDKAYQKHWTMEQYGNNPEVIRSWFEYVSPRSKTYNKPVIVLVGRWTGSMGEGLAIGFAGIGSAQIVGTEMERLAGEMNGFNFLHQTFGFRLSTAKLFHVNGTAREKYVPEHYVQQTQMADDETIEYATKILNALK